MMQSNYLISPRQSDLFAANAVDKLLAWLQSAKQMKIETWLEN